MPSRRTFRDVVAAAAKATADPAIAEWLRLLTGTQRTQATTAKARRKRATAKK